MRAGEFEDGTHVLRAKIDMASPNITMRDPPIYRIRHASHHRTGDAWCIYPLYDYTHCLSDSIEGITHSLCTLEFEDQRPFYDWVINTLDTPYKPQQIEFARLNLNYTVMSKRKLLKLVQEGHVRGWDDPRMPTLVGLRRRGYTPEAIRAFIKDVTVTKFNAIWRFAPAWVTLLVTLCAGALTTLTVGLLTPSRAIVAVALRWRHCIWRSTESCCSITATAWSVSPGRSSPWPSSGPVAR